MQFKPPHLDKKFVKRQKREAVLRANAESRGDAQALADRLMAPSIDAELEKLREDQAGIAVFEARKYREHAEAVKAQREADEQRVREMNARLEAEPSNLDFTPLDPNAKVITRSEVVEPQVYRPPTAPRTSRGRNSFVAAAIMAAAMGGISPRN